VASRLLLTHVYGINDSFFNQTVRKILHNSGPQLGWSDYFPSIYLLKGGFRSKMLKKTLLARCSEDFYNDQSQENAHILIFSLAMTLQDEVESSLANKSAQRAFSIE